MAPERSFSPETKERILRKAARKIAWRETAAEAMDIGKGRPRFRDTMEAAVDEALGTASQRTALAQASSPKEAQEAQQALRERKAELAEQREAEATEARQRSLAAWKEAQKERLAAHSPEQRERMCQTQAYERLSPQHKQAIDEAVEELAFEAEELRSEAALLATYPGQFGDYEAEEQALSNIDPEHEWTWSNEEEEEPEPVAEHAEGEPEDEVSYFDEEEEA
jgi:transposase-like protein